MALEELIDSWNENDDSEEGGRKAISEKTRDKLTDRRTWERDAKLFNAALQLRKDLGDGLFTDHNEFRSRLDDALESQDQAQLF